MKRVLVELPDSAYRNLKMSALNQGVSAKSLTLEAVVQYLQRNPVGLGPKPLEKEETWDSQETPKVPRAPLRDLADGSTFQPKS